MHLCINIQASSKYCININTSTHIYTYAHTQTNNAFAYKHAHLDGYSLHSSHTCVHMRAHVCTWTYVHMSIRIYAHPYITTLRLFKQIHSLNI